MKILQLCNFSAGISGVWTRVVEDSAEFIKRGHEVFVFSSDMTESGSVVNPKEDELDGMKIRRFPVKMKIGYAVWFAFEKDAFELKPDVIICHGLRKPYLVTALRIAKKLKAKCFLVTHAPFIDKELRSWKLNMVIRAYDYFIGAGVMNSFDKVIAICKWEKKDLLERGCDAGKILYLPNSLSEDFFVQEPAGESKKIIFMGRMNPVKDIALLIEAFKESDLKEYHLEIVSSLEGEYYQSLLSHKNERTIFTKEISNLKEKIAKIDSAEIFVLPSKKESLPFGVIEAMARGKIVVATKTLGSVELIKDGENGFLIEIGDLNGLKDILNKIKDMPPEKKNRIKVAAMLTSREFRVSKIMNQWEELFKK